MKHLFFVLWITVTFLWDAPTQYVDGAPLPAPEILEYRIYRRPYKCFWGPGFVARRTTTTYVWDAPEGIDVYEVAVTAVATNGKESKKSNIVIVNMNTYKNPT